MIFPYLNGVLGFRKVPITWILFALNVAVYLISTSLSVTPGKELNRLLSDDFFISTNGKAFAQYIYTNPHRYSGTLVSLSNLVIEGDSEKAIALGNIALGDLSFIQEAPTLTFDGDQVAFSWWRERLKSLDYVQTSHPSYIFGLNSSDVSFTKWLSYQFAHSGDLHLLGNMLFLLLFGSMLEPVIGGLALLVVYLGSGMVAAGSFLAISGTSMIPLIGASGAISGLMALFCFMFWKAPVRYVYFLLIPKKGYAGYILLPAWLTLVLWLASDLAGYIASVKYVGGIAHIAHLGGEAAGLCVGLTLYLLGFRKKFSKVLAKQIAEAEAEQADQTSVQDSDKSA